MYLKIDDIESYEFEITNNCNAKCVLCARTGNISKIENISFKQFIKIFDGVDITNKEFIFSGSLGEPLMNNDFLAMLRFLVKFNTKILINTNASLRNEDYWIELAKILNKSSNECGVLFNVDGHEKTNHLYRINTNFQTIKRNMSSYINSGGKGVWQYIVFDHNECDIEISKKTADDIGIPFRLRKSWRNNIGISFSSKKDEYKHSEFDTSIKKINHINENINCYSMNKKQVFISSDLRVWPCCYFRDSHFNKKDVINNIFKKFGENFNNLEFYNISDILKSEYYHNTLINTWKNRCSPFFNEECTKSCGGSRNIVEYVNL